MEDQRLGEMIEMIGSMASLDFSKRLQVETPASQAEVIAYGLNMLSEELEANMIRRTILEEANSNLERFAYTVAHDLKSPLNSAVGLTLLMEKSIDNDESHRLREYVGLLKKVHLKIQSLIEGILEYSRTNFDEASVQVIDLQQLCNEMVTDFMRDNTSVLIRMEGNLPSVFYNPTALKQVLSNLIENSIKYNDKTVCEILISCRDNGDHHELAISDNGPGIDAEHHGKVFDLFENLNNKRPDSHGIGLSLVKKIVNQAKGTIGLSSTMGEGCRFYFTIPKK